MNHPTLTAIVPNFNAGFGRHEVHGDNPQDLARELRELITLECYGASDIGGMFSVYRDGARIGDVAYNGTFHLREELRGVKGAV
jgi:hypothetical protein